MLVHLGDGDSLLGVLLEHLSQNVDGLGGQEDVYLLEVPVDDASVVLADHLVEVVASEYLASCQQVVQDHSAGEYVHFLVVQLVLEHFWCHVAWSAAPGQQPVLGGHELAQPEIG